MKTHIKHLSVLSLAFAAISHLYGQGYIVPSGVTYGGFDGVGYEINVLHNPVNTNNGYTGFALEPNGKVPPNFPFVNIFKFDPIVDVGVRVFFVSPNDPISFQEIQSQSYQELSFPNSYVFNVGTPVYVGLYTGNQQFAPPDGIYADPLFGWAELVNNNGVIQLVDSALEYQGGGIIAGTTTILPIPEPGTFFLSVIGGAGMLLALHRHRSFQK